MTDLGSTHFIQFCIQYASIALLYYDYTLTFSMEVEYVWKARFRLSTILYILCRYALVANVIYLLNIGQKIGIKCIFSSTLMQPINVPPCSCDGGYMISGALSVLGRAAIVVVWTMRTYAVWNRNRLVLAVLSIIGAACIILSIIHVPAIRCEKNSSVPMYLLVHQLNRNSCETNLVPLLLAILMCIFEFFSTALATFRSLQALGANGFYIRCRRNAFVFLVLEQGILYFSTTSLFTIASVVLNITVPGGFMQRLLNGLTLPLSGLLAARFLLHLRKWEDKQSRHHSCVESSTNLQLTTVIETVLSYVDIDDFGEDPLRRAERCMNAAPGVVVEEWKKYGGWCDNEGLDS
ncbi:hypothetical protein Hypma_004606 [Hypsizygus marmoreus]|uniref:DUF6533 domain-containing protein n=1 Tax=Hypsizygus marmoreus TaxID=39966 RepID=A0A369K3B8_HYPMA|nr:hypothetical protein Hypma_004606 [Hypsizygus marmoreus]